MSPPDLNRPPCDNFTRGYPGRPPSRRAARVLCDRDGLLLTRVRARSGALCPSWAAAVPAFSWSPKASSFAVDILAEMAMPLSLIDGVPRLRVPMTVGQLYGASPLLPSDD